jgi:AmmeMemoRadiSam system protein B
MDAQQPVPRLRQDLEIIPTSYQGERAFLVRDYLGLIQDPVILQGDTLNLLGLLDGKRTVRDIQVELVRLRRGGLVDSASIEKMIQELDSATLLHSPRYETQKEKILAEYARLAVREPSHAGASYPAEPDRLQDYLHSILEKAGEDKTIPPGLHLRALIAPHIDLEVGQRVYGRAYRAIQGMKPRRVVLLGTGHSLDDGVFALTKKDFLTPLGRVETDGRAVRRLREAGGNHCSASDIAHRREHSLEFELLFLQHAFGSSFSLVPVLCGSLSRELGRVCRPAEIPGVGRILTELRSYWEEDPAGTLLVAGVDFSHIGPKFGHRERATSLLLEARSHDLALIKALTAGDVRAFWAESRRVQDRFNVCGFSAMAFLLEIFPEARGLLLDYEFWMEESTQSAVSFAAAVLGSA